MNIKKSWRNAQVYKLKFFKVVRKIHTRQQDKLQVKFFLFYRLKYLLFVMKYMCCINVPFFKTFYLLYTTKHFMSAPLGNREFCFPRHSMRLLGKHKLAISKDDNSDSHIPDSEQLESNEKLRAIFESDSEDSGFDEF